MTEMNPAASAPTAGPARVVGPASRLPYGGFVLAAAFLSSATAAGAQIRDPYVVLEGASERFASVERLCADFHQVLSVPLLDQEREGTGRLCQARPNLFSMRFDDPQGDALVVDGEYAWMYTPSQDPGQVLRTSASRIGNGLDFQREFLESPREKYEASLEDVEDVAGRPCRRILLEPYDLMGYQAAVVWIDVEERLLRRVEVREENGSVRTITLSGIEVNGDVPDGTFTFTPPPGTQVITR